MLPVSRWRNNVLFAEFIEGADGENASRNPTFCQVYLLHRNCYDVMMSL